MWGSGYLRQRGWNANFRLDRHISRFTLLRILFGIINNDSKTYLQMPSMTFWQGELLMNRFALPSIANSMAFPTRSPMSISSSCSAFCNTSGLAPEKRGQLVVATVVRSSISSAWKRRARMARISHRVARDCERVMVEIDLSREKWTRLSRKQNTIDLLPWRCSTAYLSSKGFIRAYVRSGLMSWKIGL